MRRSSQNFSYTNTSIIICCDKMEIISLPKVISGEGRIAAVTYVRRKVSIGYNGAPKMRPKSTPSSGPIRKPHYLPHPGHVRPMMPNGIRIRSVVFPQCTGQTDAPTHVRTDRPTDRPRESLTTIGRYATRATRPDNNDTRSKWANFIVGLSTFCLLYTSPSPRDRTRSRMPSSA